MGWFGSSKLGPTEGSGLGGRMSSGCGRVLVGFGLCEWSLDFAKIFGFCWIWPDLKEILADLKEILADLNEIRPDLEEILADLNEIRPDLEEIRWDLSVTWGD